MRGQRAGKQRDSQRDGAGKCEHPYVERHVGGERERFRQNSGLASRNQQIGDGDAGASLPAGTAPGSR